MATLRTNDARLWEEATVDVGFGTGKNRWKKPTVRDWQKLDSGPVLSPAEYAAAKNAGAIDKITKGKSNG